MGPHPHEGDARDAPVRHRSLLVEPGDPGSPETLGEHGGEPTEIADNTSAIGIVATLLGGQTGSGAVEAGWMMLMLVIFSRSISLASRASRSRWR